MCTGWITDCLSYFLFMLILFDSMQPKPSIKKSCVVDNLFVFFSTGLVEHFSRSRISLFKRNMSCTTANRLILPKVRRGIWDKTLYTEGSELNSFSLRLYLLIVFDIRYTMASTPALENYPVDYG